MNERRLYKNPPIEEALCEFRFEAGQEWDPTIPGRLHVELAREYRGKPQQQLALEAEVSFPEGDKPNLMVRQGLARVQLVTENKKRIVAVGPDVLSIHMLRPYQDPTMEEVDGWKEFRERIERALAAYWKVAKPRGVRRVGVRYINKILVSERDTEPRKYISCAPARVEGLPGALRSFVGREEYAYDDGGQLVITYATTEGPEKQPAFLLDIDAIWQANEWLDFDGALERVELLRGREREAFEAVITDEARRGFDAD